MLLQQLEERIVLDAAVNPAVNENPDYTAAGQSDGICGHDFGPGSSSRGRTCSRLPDDLDQVFQNDQNVVMVANQPGDIAAGAEAAATGDGPAAGVFLVSADLDVQAAANGDPHEYEYFYYGPNFSLRYDLTDPHWEYFDQLGSQTWEPYQTWFTDIWGAYSYNDYAGSYYQWDANHQLYSNHYTSAWSYYDQMGSQTWEPYQTWFTDTWKANRANRTTIGATRLCRHANTSSGGPCHCYMVCTTGGARPGSRMSLVHGHLGAYRSTTGPGVTTIRHYYNGIQPPALPDSYQ
jgi:hypothetical protein